MARVPRRPDIERMRARERNTQERIRKKEIEDVPAGSGGASAGCRAGWFTSGPGGSPAAMDPQSLFNHSLWYPWFGELRDSTGGFALCTAGVTPNVGAHKYGIEVADSGLYLVQWRGKLAFAFSSAQTDIFFEPRIRLESAPADSFAFELGYLAGDRIHKGSGSAITIACDIGGLVALEAGGKVIPYAYCEGDGGTDPSSGDFWGTYNDVSFGTELLVARVGDADGVMFV